MTTINIDFDVFKALTARRESEDVSYNDVLRDLLELRPNKISAITEDGQPGDWVTNGVRFPQGTEFRANYKGQTYRARVEGGALLLDGKKYSSPSLAGVSITDYAVNGWHFWECKFP